MFNQGRLWEDPMADAHPSSERSREPVCTHSQIIASRDGSGKKVAVVHRYIGGIENPGPAASPIPSGCLSRM